MKKALIKKSQKSEELVTKVVAIESVVNQLPQLSALEKSKLENSRAIDHLYYSSKLEGTQLTQKKIDRAIYGKEIPTVQK